jgi:hypothetical protein
VFDSVVPQNDAVKLQISTYANRCERKGISRRMQCEQQASLVDASPSEGTTPAKVLFWPN